MSASYPKHPNAVILPPPINVSPLIRLSRYVALGLGIIWGAWRLSSIREYHADIRDWEHEKKLAKAEEAAKLKKWANKEETKSLMQGLGIPFEEGKVQFGMEHVYSDE